MNETAVARRRGGRKPATDRFETRAGLVYSVCLRHRHGGPSLGQIATYAKVSVPTIARIVRRHEGMSLEELHRRRETAERRLQPVGEKG